MKALEKPNFLDTFYPLKCRLFGHDVMYLTGRDKRYFVDCERCKNCHYWMPLEANHPVLEGVIYEHRDYSSNEILKILKK